MKRRKTEIDVLLQEMGIVQAYSMDDIVKKLKKNCGEELTQRIIDCVYQRGEDDEEPSDDLIYSLINSTIEASITFVGGFDGGYFKKSLEEIIKYPEYIGKKVIDIGCNNGLYTCCLAKLFPNSFFYGVDINEKSIKMANELAEHFNIINVSFGVCDLNAITDTYDTVFMSKVVHEIVDIYDVDWEQSREQIVEEYFKRLNPITKNIRRSISDKGTFIAIERLPYSVATYGYIKALCDAGIDVRISEYKQIPFITVGERESMPFILGKVGNSDLDSVDKLFNEILDEQERNI